MNSWIKKEKEKPKNSWKKNDDWRNRSKNDFIEVRAKPASGIASVVVGGMNVEKFYDEMKKSSFSWIENSLI